MFSEKLERLFNETAILLSEFPEIGIKTDYPDIRIKVIKNYKLFYQNFPDKIQIIRVWDNRQNPDNLEIV
ncbi:MAG: type II toxin-antitoxin system RelE/ParE family toxin [Cytophagia bacterium]|nr:type II toxin-antitoxin system RelE/ParE family toxin [Cytophagia bacterium]